MPYFKTSSLYRLMKNNVKLIMSDLTKRGGFLCENLLPYW